MVLQERIKALSELGAYLSSKPAALEPVLLRAHQENQWFTPENTGKALRVICDAFLDLQALRHWTNHYQPGEPVQPRKVGLVMAGNIPLAGFHDLLCVFACGHISKIKLSDKDKVILPHLLQVLEQINPDSRSYFETSERLSDFDAVIATGSNNSARYFESYFGKYPHIIRKNRNAVAILNGQETGEQLRSLGEDIFTYFGLGCRSVAKLYVPQGYDFQRLFKNLEDFKELVLHNKYKNNFDYNYTLCILNKIPHDSDGVVLLTEDPALTSRVACLHYEYYEDKDSLEITLNERKEEIQCIVSAHPVGKLPVIAPGKAQQPGLTDYADGVDTMQFLLGI